MSTSQPPAHVVPDVTGTEFERLFDSLSTWGRWGAGDQRGALHLIAPERVASAARLVRAGLSVSLSLPVNTQGGPHNPAPADHRMVALGPSSSTGSTRVVKDYVGMNYHNDGHTHIDALCHVGYRGRLYNGSPESAVTERGARKDTIEVLRDGLIGRGVLLDIPRARGSRWLEPGEHVFTDDLEAAERTQGVAVHEGDILLVRTGHALRLAERGPWNTAARKAGLHPSAMPFMADRGVAALGSDGNNDTAPSTTEGVDLPIHALALAAMGIHLMDYLQFEELRETCQQLRRWEFMFVAAPLRLVGGTGSPINPIAIF